MIRSGTDMPLNLKIGGTYEAEGHRVIYEGPLGDGLLRFVDIRTTSMVRFQNPETGVLQIPDVPWVMRLLREQMFKAVDDVLSTPSRCALPEHDPEEIDRLDSRARYRLFVVRELLKAQAKCSDPDIGRKLTSIWTPEVEAKWGAKPANSSARRWLRRFIGGDNPRLVALMSRSGRVPRASMRIGPEMREIIADGARKFYANRGYRIRDAEAYVAARRKEINEVRNAAGVDELPKVSRSTIRRAINSIRCHDTLAEKYGKSWAKRHYSVSGESLHTQRLLQLGMIDDKQIDGICVLDIEKRLPAGRPWLCFIMDVHTRCILGWFVDFQSPTLHSAAESFKHACLPKLVRADRRERYPVLEKIFGQFGEIIADNGSNYAAAGFEDMLADCGTAFRLAAVGTPTHKASLERLFDTIRTMLFEKLPGATFDPSLMREMGYDPAKDAVLTINELLELIEGAIYLYHITDHSVLGMPPARAWELSMGQHGINMLADPARINQFIGDTHRCRLTKNGFNIEGVWFRDRQICRDLLDDLDGLQKVGDRLKNTASAWIKVRYNSANLREAYVWNRRTKRYVTVPAANQRYADGLSLYQHKQIKAWSKREARAFNSEDEQLLARYELNQRIKEIAPDLEMRDRGAVARMMGSPSVRRLEAVPTALAEPRHDGMGSIIEVAAAADERDDGGILYPRPPIGEVKMAPESPLDSTLEQDVQGFDDDWDDIDVDVEGDDA